MALEEHDREDLVRDGRAFAYRGETRINEEPVFVGVREDGRWSVYWGNRCVWQFDQGGTIRRAHWRNCRISRESDKLVWLTPQARGARLQFIRTVLEEKELHEFQQETERALQVLRVHLKDNGACAWHAAFPNAETVHQKVMDIM